MPITKVVFYNEWDGKTYTKEIKSTELKFMIERCDTMDSLHEFLSLLQPEGWSPITGRRRKAD